MFGSILSATDPVAVVALLKAVGASKRLGTLIEAESLFNDGSAFVFFLIWRDFMIGEERTPGEVTVFLLQLSLGGVALGLLVGCIAVVWLAYTFNEPEAETAVTLALAYFTFWLAESGDIDFHVSGVLATVVLGLTVSKYKSYISVGSSETLHTFWEVLSYIVNTLIFFISGLLVALRLFVGSDHLTGRDFAFLGLLYVGLHIIRGFTILALSPILSRMGYGFDFNTGAVLLYGGLRGAVSLALALIVGLEEEIEEEVRDRILFHVAGIVLLTISINGTTTGQLLKFLGLTDSKGPERRAFRTALKKISTKSNAKTIQLRKTKEYVDTDWGTVAELLPKYENRVRSLVVAKKKYQDFDLDDEELLRFGEAFDYADMKTSEKKALIPDDALQDEIYHRLLTAIKADFWMYYEEGRTTPTTIAILDEAAETARDLRSLQELWRILKEHSNVPHHIKWMENCWQWLATQLLLKNLSLAIELNLAFQHALTTADHHLEKFFSDFSNNDTYEKIKGEIAELLAQAEEDYADAQASFPLMLRVMQTEKAARLILKEEEKEINHLYHEGILQDREYEIMKKLVQKSEFCIVTNPLRTHALKETDVVSEMCFWHHLDCKTQRKVHNARKRLYNKGELVRDKSSLTRGLDIVIKGLLSVHDEENPKHVIKTLSISDTLGFWSMCTGEAHLGSAYARSQPLIVSHLPGEVCKEIMKTSVRKCMWKLAGSEVLMYYHHEQIKGYSRFNLDRLCLKGHLRECKEPTRVSIKWPTVILQGSATHVNTGVVCKPKYLIDPSSPPTAAHVKKQHTRMPRAETTPVAMHTLHSQAPELGSNGKSGHNSARHSVHSNNSVNDRFIESDKLDLAQDAKSLGDPHSQSTENTYILSAGCKALEISGLNLSHDIFKKTFMVTRPLLHAELKMRRCISDEHGDKRQLMQMSGKPHCGSCIELTRHDVEVGKSHRLSENAKSATELKTLNPSGRTSNPSSESSRNERQTNRRSTLGGIVDL